MNHAHTPAADPSAAMSERRAPLWTVAAILLAAGLGLLTSLHPAAAVFVVAGLILIPLSLLDLSLVVTASLVLAILGEPSGLSYKSFPMGGVNLFANDLLLLLLLGLLILRALRQGFRLTRPAGAAGGVLLLYILYGVFSLARSIPLQGKAALPGFRVDYLYALLFFLVLPLFRGRKERRRLLIGFFLASAAVGLTGLWNLITGHPVGGITGSHTRRYLSGLQAMIPAFALGLLWATVWVRSRPLWSQLFALLCLFGILISQARSVWLGGLLGLILVAFFAYGWRRMLLVVGAPLAVLAALVAGATNALRHVPVLGLVVVRAGSFANVGSDVTTLWRLVVWWQALLEWTASPILGLGLGRRFAYLDTAMRAEGGSTQLHNSYLHLLCTSGMIGVALLITFQVLVLRKVLLASRRAVAEQTRRLLLVLAGCQICLAAVAFTNVVSESMVSTTYIWILSAVSLIVAREAEREEQDQGPERSGSAL